MVFGDNGIVGRRALQVVDTANRIRSGAVTNQVLHMGVTPVQGLPISQGHAI